MGSEERWGHEGMTIVHLLHTIPPGRSTVPNIFIKGQPVGGFTDGVEALHKEGKLKPMLQEAGAL